MVIRSSWREATKHSCRDKTSGKSDCGANRSARSTVFATALRPQPGGDGSETTARLGPPQEQEWPDGVWVVRRVPGAAAAKTYRCPGCDQEIIPGTPHMVVWPEQDR